MFYYSKLLILLLFVSLCDGSYHLHDEFGPLHIKTPTISPYIGLQEFNFTTYITYKAYDNLCSIPSKTDVADRIVLYNGDIHGCSLEDMARNVQEADGKAILSIPAYARTYGSFSEDFEESSVSVYVLDGSDTTDIKIPYLTVVKKNMKGILSLIENKQLIRFQAIPDNNPYLKPFNTLLFSRIMSWVYLTPWCLINFYLAIDTFIFFIKKENGFSFRSLPLMASGIETISNLIRLIFVSLGPFLTWNIWSWPVFSILMVLTWPLQFLTSLIIAFYWKIVCENIKTLSTSGLDIHNYRYIIIIVFFLDLITCYIPAIMRASYYPAGIWVPINALVEFIACGCLSIYFITQGNHLITILKKHTEAMKSIKSTTTSAIHTEKAATKMSKWVIASGIFTLIYLIGIAGIGSPFFYSRYCWQTIFHITYIGLLGTSTTQIIAFRTQIPKKKADVITNNNTMKIEKKLQSNDTGRETIVFISQENQTQTDIELN